MSNEIIEAIDRNIRQARTALEEGNALERLRDNKDFKKVVLEGYFKDEAVRLVHLKADPSMQSDASQKSIVAQIDAIGSFSSYLTQTLQRGVMAGKQIESDEATREEILAEELSNG